MMRIKSAMFAVITGAVLFAYACSSGGSQDPGADAATAPRCGDGICNATEVNSCPADCGTSSANAVCGNGTCEASKGETAASCPADCGQGSGSNTAMCGNGICETGENSTNCPGDCGGGMMGSGNLDCNDETVIEECLNCVFDSDCTGVDEPDCEVCLGL